MLRLSKKADYALIAMKHLALSRDGAVSVSAREIAEQYDIPIELMAKVLQRLVRSGLLVSTQGTRGGYTLRLPAASISVSDVIQAIDGPFSVTACSTENIGCEQYSKCSVRDPLWQIRERIAAALATVSVAELAADQIKGDGLRPDAETVSAPVAIMRRARVAADL
jgi:Rrf2 family protein